MQEKLKKLTAATASAWDPDSPIQDRDFLILWFSQLMTSLAAGIFGIAVAIISNTEGLGSNYEDSAFGVALILFFTNIPGLFFSIFAGVMADWFNRKTIMFITTLVRFVLAMIFVVFTGWQVATVAYIIIFLKSGVTQVYMPSQASVIPDIVKKKNIMFANSIFNLTNYSTYFVGVLGAGPFIKIFGERNAFTALGSMFLIGGVVIPFIRVPKRETKISFGKFLEVVYDFFLSVVEGLRYIWSGRVQRFAMIHNFLVTSALFVIVTLIFKLANFLLGIDARDVGFSTIIPVIVGIVTSVYYLNTIAKNNKRVAIISNGMFFASISFVIFTALTFLRYNEGNLVPDTFTQEGIETIIKLSSFVAMTLVGFAFPLLIIPAQTLIHEDTKQEYRGRVFGVWFAINQALATIPAMFVGLMADSSLGLPRATTVLTVSILIYTFVLIKFRKLA